MAGPVFDNIKQFSQLTDIGVRVIAHDGSVVFETEESKRDQAILAYINGIAETPLQDQTRATMISGAMQSYRFGGRFFFFSPIGLFHFASPIISDGKHTITAIGGPILLLDTEEYIQIELADKLTPGFDANELKKKIDLLPHVSTDKANSLSEQLLINVKHLSDKEYLGDTESGMANRYSDYILAYFAGMPTYESILHLAEEQLHDKAIRKRETLVNTVRRYVSQNYTKKITLEEAAKRVFVSPSYLSKAIKEQTGAGFRELTNQARITEAQRLLAQTDMPIAQISHTVGFTDHSYFTKVFTHYTKLTPSAYRKMLV